jgi:hypothetical protein
MFLVRYEFSLCIESQYLKVKCNAIAVTGIGSQWGCETSWLVHFLNNRLTHGGEVSLKV